MNRRLVSASCAFMLCFLTSSVQADNTTEFVRDPKTNRIVVIKPKPEQTFKHISKINTVEPTKVAERFLAENARALGIALTDLKLLSHSSDRLGITHLRYGQFYKGIPVFGAEVLVHITSANQIASVTSSTVDKLQLNIIPKVVAAAAIARAQNFLFKQGVTESLTPVATKLYVFDTRFFDSNTSRSPDIAWEVKLKRAPSQITETFYISAKTGQLLYQENDLREINRNVYDCSQSDNCLLDVFSETYDYWFGRSESAPPRGPNPINGLDDVDRLFDLARSAHDYWLNMFDRDGANSVGGLGDGLTTPYEITRVDAFINNSCPRSYYFNDRISFCKGMNSPDVVGHEYLHGVVRNSIFDGSGSPIGLSKYGDPGALNESFAETFGEMLEYALTGDNDWISGGDLTEPNVSRISLSDPNYYMLSYRPYAARTYDPYFYCGGVNTLYIYLNSTVLSHASYLASMGSGPEGFNGCTIEAIGREKVARIWYRALTMYFTNTETFTAAYQALVQSCEDLYPDPTDPTCWQLTKALRSVQLDQAGLCSGIPEQAPVCDLCPDDENKELPGECGCGVPDTDTDEDGTADCLDGCVNDPAKTAPGTCGCGVPDVDTDADGVMDCVDGCPADRTKTSPGVCGCGFADTDTDGDGTADCNDLCPADPAKTAPGVCGCGTADTDTDGDGTPNCNDQCPNDPGKVLPGTCGCGVADVDTDSDGVMDCVDGCPGDRNKTAPGVCGCGTADTDSDGDGTPNCNDNCPNDPGKVQPGVCGCGTADTDTDGDGTPNCNDQCPADPGKILPGVCGCGVADTDSDGDGTPNCRDSCPTDRRKTSPGTCGCGTADTDTDGDGTPDCNDLCPVDPGKIVPGACGCGTADTDSDNDGTPNCNDGCPADPGKIVPGVCGCGTADTDSDGDGTPNCNDGCPTDPGKIVPGVCGCGTADTDSDNDGTPNCNDLCPSDPGKVQPGTCGCGTADTDSDGDGTPNCNDGCPSDPAKVQPGVCGCGAADTDSDGDGTPNCNDQCPNDPTKIVPGTCGCGTPEPGPDSDGDGYPAYNACNGINDCNDNDASINPGHTEVCGDGKDNNCSGQIDENCSTVCNDSDNGLNWYTAGTVTANGRTYRDSCVFGLFVVENYCLLKRFPAEAFMICIKGCTAGACRR